MYKQLRLPGFSLTPEEFDGVLHAVTVLDDKVAEGVPISRADVSEVNASLKGSGFQVTLYGPRTFGITHRRGT